MYGNNEAIWRLHLYLVEYYKVSFDTNSKQPERWLRQDPTWILQVKEGNDELTTNINLLSSYAHHYTTNKRNINLSRKKTRRPKARSWKTPITTDS